MYVLHWMRLKMYAFYFLSSYLIYTDAPSMQKIIASTDHDRWSVGKWCSVHRPRQWGLHALPSRLTSVRYPFGAGLFRDALGPGTNPCLHMDSNPWPSECQSSALPLDHRVPSGPKHRWIHTNTGAAYWNIHKWGTYTTVWTRIPQILVTKSDPNFISCIIRYCT